MNKILYIFLLIAFASCQNQKSEKTNKSVSDLTELEKEMLQTFSDVDSLLEIDNGAFWNKKLYGPIILINPETRIFYTNENNQNKDFKKIGAIYTDSLPQEINIANTAINWDNKRWSMIMQPLPKDKTSRNNLIIHELFHRIQPRIGYENLQESSNGHLDIYNGRLLLKLELQALEKALVSDDDDQRQNHIKNALTFRNKRHINPEIKNAENSLELNEGLAEYTAIMLSGRNESELNLHLIHAKNVFYSNPTFVRSFAYQTIPMYGYLLSSIKPNWHKEINRNTNLTDFLIRAFNVSPDKSMLIEQIVKQNKYGYEQIAKEETEREKKRIDKISKLKIKFMRNPTLELPFQNMNISFDPRNIIPIEDLGTVYPNLRVSDNWGILTVENGALLASNWSKVTVSTPIEISNKIIKGDGWQLELNDGWAIEKNNKEYKLINR